MDPDNDNDDTEDFDDPDQIAEWLDEQREAIVTYLTREKLEHSGLEASPEWFLAPYVSVWVVAARGPKLANYRVIAGDLPTDYVSTKQAGSAREALQFFAKRWAKAAKAMQAGE